MPDRPLQDGAHGAHGGERQLLPDRHRDVGAQDGGKCGRGEDVDELLGTVSAGRERRRAHVGEGSARCGGEGDRDVAGFLECRAHGRDADECPLAAHHLGQVGVAAQAVLRTHHHPVRGESVRDGGHRRHGVEGLREDEHQVDGPSRHVVGARPGLHRHRPRVLVGWVHGQAVGADRVDVRGASSDQHDVASRSREEGGVGRAHAPGSENCDASWHGIHLSPRADEAHDSGNFEKRH